jgi:hypothetical protein
MKSLFITLLLFGGAFLAYDYFGAPPGTKMIFKGLNPPPSKVGKNVELEKGSESAAPMPEPAKVVTEAPKKVMPEAAPEAPVPPAAKGPHFETIETLTGNWLKIPESAFSPPREIKLLQDAEFKMSVGTSKVTAGGIAFVMGAANGVLTLAPTATSPARAQLPIDGTDLKARLNKIYEDWKIVRAEELKAIASRKQQMAAEPVAAASSSEVDSEGKPVRDGDGSYPLLVASMKRGQVTEVKPDNIIGWQPPQPTKIQGKNGWAVKVNYNAKTIFGDFPVEAQALVVDGRVQGWFYVGSGEEVP